MAIFNHPRAFHDAHPVDVSFRSPAAGDPHAVPATLAGHWSVGDDGRPIWRWRVIPAPLTH